MRGRLAASTLDAVLHAALAMAATLISLAFCLSTLERWLTARKPHELAWTVSLAMYAGGSAALWWGAGMGWGEWSFKLFYLFGAILNVPFLALGTVYLLCGRRAGDLWSRLVALAAAFCAGVVLAAPLAAPVPADGLPQGSEVFGVAPRAMAGIASGVAATFIIGGALWSAARLIVGRRRPGQGAASTTGGISAGRLAAANLLIAAGALVNAAGGLLNSVMDAMDAFAVSLVAGIALIFTGFLVSAGGRGATDAASVRDAPRGRRSPPPSPAHAAITDDDLDWLAGQLTDRAGRRHPERTVATGGPTAPEGTPISG